MSRWLAEGRTLGASLGRFNCIVVVGPNPDATAEVALGVAEAQAAHRRVVLGDLLDDAARYSAFRGEDDHHGIVDALQYGTSIARITRPVVGTAGLFFAPTGSDIADYGELLGHPRWSRLITSFTESGDLFVIALPQSASGLDDLVAHADGVILVEGPAPEKLDPARVIARVQAAERAPARPKRTSPPAVRAIRSSLQGFARQATNPGVAARRIPSGPVAIVQPPRRLGRPLIMGTLLGSAGVIFALWLAGRATANSVPTTGPTAGAVSPVLKLQASAPDANVLDPSDAGAAIFAVQISSANTQAGAILKLQEDGGSLPAATYSQVTIGGIAWYRVVTGAFNTRGGADSLLKSLRASKVVDSTLGIVVRVPYALRIDSLLASTTTTVSDALARLHVGKLPAYALEQSNGWVWILVGAFENASQADAYAQTLRNVELTPRLVIRKGRMF